MKPANGADKREASRSKQASSEPLGRVFSACVGKPLWARNDVISRQRKRIREKQLSGSFGGIPSEALLTKEEFNKPLNL